MVKLDFPLQGRLIVEMDLALDRWKVMITRVVEHAKRSFVRTPSFLIAASACHECLSLSHSEAVIWSRFPLPCSLSRLRKSHYSSAIFSICNQGDSLIEALLNAVS